MRRSIIAARVEPQVTRKVDGLTVKSESRPRPFEVRAMIVLGLSATLIASITLFAFTILSRIDDSRQKVALRVL